MESGCRSYEADSVPRNPIDFPQHLMVQVKRGSGCWSNAQIIEIKNGMIACRIQNGPVKRISESKAYEMIRPSPLTPGLQVQVTRSKGAWSNGSVKKIEEGKRFSWDSLVEDLEKDDIVVEELAICQPDATEGDVFLSSQLSTTCKEEMDAWLGRDGRLGGTLGFCDPVRRASRKRQREVCRK